MTWASHSCRDWKGNLLPQPIPQTQSCVPFVGDNDNVDVDDDDDGDDDVDVDGGGDGEEVSIYLKIIN